MLISKPEDLASESAKKHLQSVMNGARRMDRLIADLLNYSKIGQSELKLESIDVCGLIGRVIDGLSAEIHDRQAEVHVLTDHPPRVRGDAFLLEQSLTNLMTNALKFVPRGRRARIEVGAAKKADKVEVWVQDNGIGIEPEYRGRLFRMFERLHGREEYPGTGIGLAIVSRSIERLGGEMGFESAPGKGSRFWIALRASDE